LKEHIETSVVSYNEHKEGEPYPGKTLPDKKPVPASAIRFGYTSRDYSDPIDEATETTETE